MNIKTFIAKIALVFIVGSSLALPAVSFAASQGQYKTPSIWPTGFWGPLVSCTGTYFTNKDGNPAKNSDGTIPNS